MPNNPKCSLCGNTVYKYDEWFKEYICNKCYLVEPFFNTKDEQMGKTVTKIQSREKIDDK